VAGAAAALLAQPRAVVEPAPLRMALAAPAAGQVEQLARRRRHRQSGIAAHREHARLVQHQLRPTGSHGVSVTLDRRALRRQQQRPAHVVGRAGQRRRQGRGDRLHLEVAEVVAPVQDGRAGDVEEERDAAGPEMDEIHQATGCRSRRVWRASPVSGSKQCSDV
jgi:hypothetical protein